MLTRHHLATLMLLLLTLLAACDPKDSAPVLPTDPPAQATATPQILTATNTPRPTEIQVTPIVQADLPTATPPCPGAPQTHLIVGEWAQVGDEEMIPLNIRNERNTANRMNIRGRLEVLDVVKVLDGPECGENYVWYRIRRADGLEGWVAEGTSRLAFLRPYLPG